MPLSILRLLILPTLLWHVTDRVAFSQAAPAEGASDPAAGEKRTSPTDPAPPPEGYRTLGPNLFPFYVHELRLSDQTESLQVLGLYRQTSRPDGSGSTLLLPFFYSEVSKEPPDERFYLFPFYYSRTSPDDSFHYLIPFYFDHSTPDDAFQALVPFWFHLEAEEKKLSEDHVLFPLARYKNDRRIADRPVESFRLGLWRFLELWEARDTPDSSDRKAINLFNWGDVAQSGLSLFSSAWVEDRGTRSGRTYLFPLFWYGHGPTHDYLWVMPFFGYSSSGGQVDYFLLPLLSRFGSGRGDSVRLDVLFPLFHYARSNEELSISSYLLFDYFRRADRSRLGVLLWLYREYAHYGVGGDERTRLILFPLTYFHDEAGGTRGTHWLFPFLDTFDEESRLRILFPLFFRHETLDQGETEKYVTVALPSYLSFGEPTDYFAMGFPFYWASRSGDRGWEIFLPFYYHFYEPTEFDLHAPPLFSYRSLPGEIQLIIGGPLYNYRRFYDLEGKPSGWAHGFLWPLTSLESREDGYHYRLLPLFWVSGDKGSSDLLLTPLYYQQTTDRGTFRYLFPFYARSETDSETTEYYAAGTFIHSRGVASDGSLARSSVSFLWWLASFENNYREGSSHQHVLPLYWHTSTPVSDHTLTAPFYYSHRIVENDKVHKLDLVLGNLYLSSIVEPVAPDREGTEDSTPAELSREQGVLWPLSRWYRDDQGNSGGWFFPFYFDSSTEEREIFALFPLYYSQEDSAAHEDNFFRYFFLFNQEEWLTGYRITVGQLLFDWWRETQQDATRLRLFYPLLEFASSNTGFTYQVTPLIAGESGSVAGERHYRHRVFPFFWTGVEERLSAGGEWLPQSQHFYLLPLYGFETRGTRTDYYALYPLVNVQETTDSFNFTFWPIFFYRKNPALEAVRLWPFHVSESGEGAGDFWVSRYLFVSKLFLGQERTSYRLEPFLFRFSSGPDEFGIAGPLDLFAYDRTPEERSFRVIPVAFGHADAESASTAVIPFYFHQDFGGQDIDYLLPWRFFFLASSLRGGGGERHFSVLTKLFEHTDNVNRPEYHETRFLDRVFRDSQTETTRRVELNPIFQYWRDDSEERSEFSILMILYRQETVRGQTRRWLFYLIPF